MGPLTSEQVNQYRQEGYCVSKSFLEGDVLAALLAGLEAICKDVTVATHDGKRLEMESGQGPDGKQVRRVYEPCTYYPEFRALSESTKLLDAVEQLIGPNLTFHYSKINMKSPKIGAVVEWHQDLAYYPLTNSDSLTVLFYLDNANSRNGCLRVVPGCHAGPLMDHSRDGFFQGRITEAVDESKAVAIEGEAGAVIFMHSMTPHASAPNSSSIPRRTLILSYRAADAFPIYMAEITPGMETHMRPVRGEQLHLARFSMTSFPIPVYAHKTRSLYELQELSRKDSPAHFQ